MFDLAASFRTVCITVIASIVLSACGGHSQSTLPSLAPAAKLDKKPAASATAAPGDLVAIDAGGGAAGSFGSDQDFSAGSWTYTTTAAIDTSSVASPAPQAVYQSEREGTSFSYTIPGLSAGTAYTVRLSFAELWWKAAGKRVFGVTINGTKVLSNFDIFATAGAGDKAVTESFTATAGTGGTIVIGFTSVADNAAVNAVEIIAPGNATPTPAPSATPTPTAAPSATPTAPPAGALFIDAGGAAAGSFAADADYAPSSWTYATTGAINTGLVTNPAPQAVYQSEREGSGITYTIPGLTAGASYAVRLDFAELWWTAAGQRVFNVSINSTKVLSNFDVLAAAGARFKAVAQTFTTAATSAGTIVIALNAVTDYAAINGIEITPTTLATPTPAPTASAAFNDYTTFGYDNERDVYNPNSTAITPARISNLHLAWQAAIGGGDYNTQTQPVLATEIPGHAGVLFVGGGSGKVDAYDALSGSLLWTRNLGQEVYSQCGGTSYFGIGGTVAYDAASKSLYVVGNANTGTNVYASNVLYHLDAATGQILGQVNFAPAAAGPSEFNFSHTAVMLSNGVAYVGTASTCDISSWRGSVVAVNVPAMTILNTFFTLWDPQNARGQGAASWGGGGVWGWGGVAADLGGNILTGVGNADNTPQTQLQSPFVSAPLEYSGYAETLLELTPGAGAVVAANHPIASGVYGGTSGDLDVQGTPLIVAQTGCAPMVALQAKSGMLTIYDESQINSGWVAQYQMAPSSYDDAYLGDPAYSPAAGLIYADVATSAAPSLFPAGLVAINPGCGTPSVAWHAAFGSDSSGSGIPRAVPAVSAGGVVLAGTVGGTGGALWAVNAATGTVLGGGTPILQTSGYLRVPPTIDGNWVFVMDNSGNLYGLTVDGSYPAIASRRRANDARQINHWRAAHT